MKFLDDDALEQSGVVANSRMNRERNLTGSNGYSKELAFNPLELLRESVASAGHANWLDLCCGSGKALIEAARIVHCEGMDASIELLGVDLVGMFARPDPEQKCLRLVEASLTAWQPDRPFDLITCVHGLHYIGDKLRLIARAASWLTDDGRFAANLDVNNLRLQDGRSAGRIVATEFRRSGLQYDHRKKLVICVGRKLVNLPFQYLGADDQAGPNYTGQPAVNSYYNRFGPRG